MIIFYKNVQKFNSTFSNTIDLVIKQRLQKQSKKTKKQFENQNFNKNPSKVPYIYINIIPTQQSHKLIIKMSFLCSKLIHTICPCLFRKKLNLQNYGDNQLIEQQQFISPDSIEHDYEIKHHNNQSLSSTSASTSMLSTTSRQGETYSKRMEEQRSYQEEDISPKQNSPLPLITKQQQVFIDYTDVIANDHPYYDILYSKLEVLPSIFDIDQKYLLQTVESPFPLKLYCKHSQVRKTNIFVYSFQFENTNYDSYQSMLNNFQVQKTFDSNINEYYKKMESPNNDTKVIYLSYNKVLIVAPRDFIYVRYVFKKGGQNWSIATSIPNETEQQGKIRGQIILTATKVVEKNNRIYVNIYSEVNMKMAIKPQMAKNRGKTQIKKYLQKCHKYLTQNKSQTIL